VLLALVRAEGGGHMPVSAAAIVLTQEAGKLAVTAVLELRDARWRPQVWLHRVQDALSRPRNWLFAVPAVAYALNNNCALSYFFRCVNFSRIDPTCRPVAVHMQSQMDAATFQVLCNLKVGTTAVLYRVLLRRELRPQQWVAVGLLFAAAAVNSYATSRDPGAPFITPLGLAEMLGYCLVSGFAGVFTEKLLKESAAGLSFYLQNLLLYVFGVGLNAVAWWWWAPSSGGGSFTPLVWIVVASQVHERSVGVCMCPDVTPPPLCRCSTACSMAPSCAMPTTCCASLSSAARRCSRRPLRPPGSACARQCRLLPPSGWCYWPSLSTIRRGGWPVPR
jgi:drug/metabolite transporter (DMT)-like permease